MVDLDLGVGNATMVTATDTVAADVGVKDGKITLPEHCPFRPNHPLPVPRVGGVSAGAGA